MSAGSHVSPRIAGVIALALLTAFLSPALAADAKKGGGKKVEGKIKSIDTEKAEFVVTGKDDAKDYSFKLALKGRIQIADKASKLADLKVGDNVTVTYYQTKDNEMIAMTVQCKRE